MSNIAFVINFSNNDKGKYLSYMPMKSAEAMCFMCQKLETNRFLNFRYTPHFGSYTQSKLRETRRKDRYSAVKSSQLCWVSWTGQYKKCVQYDYFSIQCVRALINKQNKQGLYKNSISIKLISLFF